MQRQYQLSWPVVLIALLAAGGCENDKRDRAEMQWTPQEQVALDVGLVQTVRQAQIDNGIVAQHTLYPYHFHPGSEQLNELGAYEVRVLADSFKGRAGALNVRRGEASQGLYDARLQSVRDHLERNGIAANSVDFGTDLPGGAGMPSNRVQVNLQRDLEQQPYTDESEMATPNKSGSEGQAK